VRFQRYRSADARYCDDGVGEYRSCRAGDATRARYFIRRLGDARLFTVCEHSLSWQKPTQAQWLEAENRFCAQKEPGVHRLCTFDAAGCRADGRIGPSAANVLIPRARHRERVVAPDPAPSLESCGQNAGRSQYRSSTRGTFESRALRPRKGLLRARPIVSGRFELATVGLSSLMRLRMFRCASRGKAFRVWRRVAGRVVFAYS